MRKYFEYLVQEQALLADVIDSGGQMLSLSYAMTRMRRKTILTDKTSTEILRWLGKYRHCRSISYFMVYSAITKYAIVFPTALRGCVKRIL